MHLQIDKKRERERDVCVCVCVCVCVFFLNFVVCFTLGTRLCISEFSVVLCKRNLNLRDVWRFQFLSACITILTGSRSRHLRRWRAWFSEGSP